MTRSIAVEHTELTGQCPGQLPAQRMHWMIPAQVITQHASVPDHQRHRHSLRLGRVRNLGLRSQIPMFVISMVPINKLVFVVPGVATPGTAD